MEGPEASHFTSLDCDIFAQAANPDGPQILAAQEVEFKFEDVILNSSLKQILRADVHRYGGGAGKGAMLRAYMHHPGFRFTYYLRKVAFYADKKRSLGIVGYVFNRIMLNHYRFKYGFDISPTTRIAPGLYIGHFGGVVVSPNAVLGANVNLAQGITIGATSRGDRIGAPTLEDRVWVGANAILVGKITIGREALIAPGAYVNFDVPSHAIVLGNPGKIVSDKGSAGYINCVLEDTVTDTAPTA